MDKTARKRSISLVFSLVCLPFLLLLSACVQQSDTTPTTTSGPVKIGISLSLTGDASGDGQSLQQGYQLWQDYINKKGGLLGHQVQLVIYDDATRPEQARLNYQKLISVDKVNFTLGPFDDAFTVNGAEVAQKYGYAFLQGTGTSPQDFTHNLTNMFCVSLTASHYMASLVNYILSLPTNIRPKTVAYSTSDNAFTSSQVTPVVPLLQNGNLKTVLNQVYPQENTDLNPLAQKVVNSHADVVILGTDTLADSVAYIKYFAQQHFNPKILMATSGPDQGSAFTQGLGKTSPEGIVIANGGWWPTVKTYQNDYFVPAFIKKFGGDAAGIASDAVQAFSIGQTLEQAVKQANSLDNAKIIPALRVGTFQTLQGPVKFAADGQNTLALPYLFQWQKNNLIPVYPTDQAQASMEYPKAPW
ncbi:MAG: amino acid ABC transporter substrate-binding protein [Chloroflexota bacterium]|nr:amino acid ABC transporter substrate-binding protein [Chloroflexota bacterium]